MRFNRPYPGGFKDPARERPGCFPHNDHKPSPRAAGRARTHVRPNPLRIMSCNWPVGESPLRIAPPFRTLHLRYPVEDLAESLAEGIMTAHRAMPQFQLDSGQIVDLIAYLKSLEP
jgi:hypothetical protein